MQELTFSAEEVEQTVEDRYIDRTVDLAAAASSMTTDRCWRDCGP